MQDVRTLTPQLERVRGRVQEAVNREIQTRIRTRYGGKKLRYQSPGPWTPNAAFVNCYDGPHESVGWVRTPPPLPHIALSGPPCSYPTSSIN